MGRSPGTEEHNKRLRLTWVKRRWRRGRRRDGPFRGVAMPMSHKDLWVKIKKESKGKSPADELRLLEDYLTDWPEYKGPYQELRKKLERRVTELRKVGRVLASHSGADTDPFSVKKRGLAEVVLVGLPNVGKTSLFRALTGADADVADYPYTTLTPNVGMFVLGALEFEIVDLPPFPEGSLEEVHYAGGLKEAVLNATLVCFVVDLLGGVELQLDVLRGHMSRIGALSEGDAAGPEAEGGEGSVPDGLRLSSTLYITVGTHAGDADEGNERAALVSATPGRRCFAFPFGDGGPREVAEALCSLVDRMVVDARDPDSRDEPVAHALPSGSTVHELAGQIHKDLARRARKGRIWGPSASFEGQEVGLDHVLEPGDTVEILTR
jgi:ribosome-interacting GTPase 1